jgi:NAD(P)-dependent dehydrogenase (short-subunit alcohol dehydrogenase family)
MAEGSVVVVGGTTGLGMEVARHYAEGDRRVVITGRSPEGAATVATELGEGVTGLGFDLAQPETIAPALSDIGTVDHLVLAALERDVNKVREYDVPAATRLTILKLVGFAEVVHVLVPTMNDDSSILFFGGLAKERPYPGSTTVTTVNAGVDGLARSLTVELAPIRVNVLHPGVVGDSPFWASKPDVVEQHRARCHTGRLATTADVVAAAVFMLENRSIDGAELRVDAGWSLP